MADESGKPKLPSDEDIAARFERIRDELLDLELPELPDSEIERLQPKLAIHGVDHEGVDSQLAALESRARQAKGQYRTAVNKPTEKALAQSNQESRGLAFGMTIAYTIMGMPMIGLAIGWFIDWRLGSVLCKGIGVLAGSIIGVTMAIKMVSENANKTN